MVRQLLAFAGMTKVSDFIEPDQQGKQLSTEEEQAPMRDCLITQEPCATIRERFKGFLALALCSLAGEIAGRLTRLQPLNEPRQQLNRM